MNTHLEEIKIASNIIENINKNDLLMFQISSLDRIIQIYFSQKRRDINEEKQVIDFIFRCLDVRGPDCSILFTHLSKSKERENIIKRLHEEYEGKFDFNLVNSSLFESSYQRIKKEEEMKHLFYFSVFIAPLCLIGLIFVILLNKQTIKKLNEVSQINNKLEEELKTTKQNFDEEVKIKNKLQEELNVQNKIDDHLANFKEKIENEVKSKEKIEEEIKKRQNVEEKLENVTKQLEKSMETNKELKAELQNKEKIENELNIVKQKLDEQIKIREDLENQLNDMKTTINNDDDDVDENKSKINNENSKDFSEKHESDKRIYIILIYILAVGIIIPLTFHFIKMICYSKNQKNIEKIEKKWQEPDPKPIKKRRKKMPIDNF